MIQANAKVERVSSKKLNEVLAYQKPFSNKSRLGYIGESNSTTKEPMVVITIAEKVKAKKKRNVTDQ